MNSKYGNLGNLFKQCSYPHRNFSVGLKQPKSVALEAVPMRCFRITHLLLGNQETGNAFLFLPTANPAETFSISRHLKWLWTNVIQPSSISVCSLLSIISICIEGGCQK